ncbi:hypothetical protein [Nannocystis bainbridge]|uniref:Uncharacterized protein n=1 Tax=Nannocystis bainbridge TaxID=2995303 RepID=A0ABT5E386_9BACT|nr:hypothetical protein [Nannocystis bainbridge]MDC0720327.1 hypothetical protein [Nannocystis bainbridge]
MVGAAWGERVCTALGWEQVELRDDEGRMVLDAIVSPDRRYYIGTGTYGRRVVESHGANTMELLFSMLRDGAMLPPAVPGNYVELG